MIDLIQIQKQQLKMKKFLKIANLVNKNAKSFMLAFFVLTLGTVANAQITGTVFRDYNGDGVQQTSTIYTENGINGITVNAYNNLDVLIASRVTNASGVYNFPATGTASIASGTQVRLEFIIPTTGCEANTLIDYAAIRGAAYGSNVQFKTAGTSTVANFAINDPGEYIGNLTPANTKLITNYMQSGNGGSTVGGATSPSQGTIIQTAYNASGTLTTSSPLVPVSQFLATNAQTGTLFGMASSKVTNRLFSAAFLKRHGGFGPGNGNFNSSPGAIYLTNPSLTSTTGATTYLGSLDVLGYPTHNSTGTPAYGSGTSFTTSNNGGQGDRTVAYVGNGANVIGTNSQRGLPDNINQASNDAAAFGQVGKLSLGDLETSTDGKFLFVVNLFDRKIYQLAITNPTAPTGLTFVNSFTLPNPPLRNSVAGFSAVTGYGSTAFYDGTRGVQRPFGLKFYKGKLYIATTTTGENGGVTTNDNNTGAPEFTDLWAYVWELNPTTSTFTTVPKLQFPLNFFRGIDSDNVDESWKPWTNTIPEPYSNGGANRSYQQAMFTDIEFDVDGSMMLGFRDRFGDQAGFLNYFLSGNTANVSAIAEGDLLRVNLNKSTCTYELEKNGTAGAITTIGANNGTGPTNYTGANGEYYYDDNAYNNGSSTPNQLSGGFGSLAILQGTGQVLSTQLDPVNFSTGGIRTFNNKTGAAVLSSELYVTDGNTSTFGKSNGLGDLEFTGQVSPIEIGNRVWRDTNLNGIQDADEAGIAGVTLELVNSSNVVVGTVTTDANGSYYFSTATGTNVTGATYGLSIAPQTNYTIRVATSDWAGGVGVGDLNGLSIAKTDIIGNGFADFSDNDAALVANVPTISITTGLLGQNNYNSDFGFGAPASIGDFVFNDANNNGIQDSNENGIPNVTVVLTNPNGTTTTTTTNGSGFYSFTFLVPGTYSVAFTTPSGFTPSPANQGTNDNVDSDPIGGVVSNIVLAAGSNNNTVDAGFTQNNLNLGDLVWYDTNNNGFKEDAESGIVGATVKLYLDANNDNIADGAAIATTTTDGNGLYNFTNLAPGNYIVGVTIPTGYAAVTTNAGDPDNNFNNDNNGINTTIPGEVRSNAITLASGTEPDNGVDGDGTNGNKTLDFALRGTGSIGDLVFNDANGNGIQDAGEVGIPNATVVLTYPDGQTVTTTTNGSGNYIFPNLAPGTNYSVTFTTPTGFTPATPNQGTNDNVDSDPVGGIVTGVTVVAGVANTTVDAGFYQANLSLGNTVWYDTNNNGIKDAGETGIDGVTVNLYLDANNDNIADGSSIGTTITSGGGLYGFAGLAPGNYIVGATIPTGYAVVATNGGDADNDIDNDNNGVNTSVAGEVRSNGVTLTTGGEPATGVDGDGTNGNNTVDFGLRGTGSIGDLVFNDANGNGIQDVTETGISGATVVLTYPNGQTVTTTTNGSGNYIFPNLAPGINYSVTFTTPAGFIPSPSNVTIAGATDANDSDPISGVVSGITVTAGSVNNTVDAGFFICSVTSAINGPASICAGEAALFTATGAGSGSVYSWSFMNGTPLTATGSSVSSTWNTPGEYDITLTVTKNGCTATYVKSIVITQAVFAAAGPDLEICQGGNTTIVGGGPAGATYSWAIISGDPTSIDNGANQANIAVSPLVATVYQLTVTQNGCTRTDQVTVFINVNRNPTADAGANKQICLGTSVVIGGTPTGTPPVSSPTAPLGYIWSPSTGLNDITLANPTATITVPGVYNYQVIVFNQLTGCSDTSQMQVDVQQCLNLGNYVYYDKNNNGTQDVGDNGVNGTTVKLYKDVDGDGVLTGAETTAVATTTTTGTGLYAFTNLFSGKYIVGVTPPTGYVQAATTITSANPNNDNNTDNNGINVVGGEVRSASITLTAGGEPTTDGDGSNGNLTLDFGLTGNGSIGDFVWNDQNRDGVQNGGEVGIAGATVTLTYPDGTTTTATTTSAGAYSFPNLAPGTNYSVTFTTPTGYFVTPSNVTIPGATDANDSDPVNGVVNNVTVIAGTANTTVDAGFYPPITISGNVWNDQNGLIDDEVNRTSTNAIPVGMFVYLIDNATGRVVERKNVNASGIFTFTNVDIFKSYRIVLSTTLNIVGDLAPLASLPQGWENIGENLGAGALSGSDGINNGILSVSTQSTSRINANFGIRVLSGEVIRG